MTIPLENILGNYSQEERKQRINRLREHLHVEKYQICTERARLWLESMKKTEGRPQIIRRAKALAQVLDNITIFIEEDELIVGNTTSKPMGLEVAFWSGTWSQEEIIGLKEEDYEISEEDEEEIRIQNAYWEGQTYTNRYEQLFDEERLWPFMKSGLILPPWKPGVGWSGRAEGGLGLSSDTLVAVEYEKVLRGGLNKIIEEAEQELKSTRYFSADSVRKVDFLKSVIIAHQAVIRFANRFAEMASKMALLETNENRKQELERIADTCRWVPANPARNFNEAIQSLWFIFLMLNPNMVVSLGRFDQYMYPFYKKDIEEGLTTDEDVLDLLQCFRIKDMQLNRTSSRAQREKWSGLAKWHNCIIGGQTSDGSDATNELSFLVLEAAKRCQTPHHTITLRVHEGTPEALMMKALEVVKTGIGMPAFVGDNSNIEFLLNHGISLEQARDYTLAGCLDVNLPGKSRILAYPMFVVPRVLEYTLNNGRDPKTGEQIGLRTGEDDSFETFTDLMNAFKKQLAHFMELIGERSNLMIQVWAELFPDPIASSLMHDAIKEGKALFERSFLFENAAVLNPVAMVNAADSLTAIKQLVFDLKKVSMKELKTALASNWHGSVNEGLQKMFRSAPKYGNNDDYADLIVKELYQFWSDTAATIANCLGGTQIPAAISISSQWPGGAITGATPDGRNAGDCLADGSLSAIQGMDMHGPTALLNSAMKVEQGVYQATLLNLKLHPTTLKTDEDIRKLSYLIRTYFSNGGKHIQFNVVDRDTLLQAQKQPEKHRDLIVRIAGYSAYFVQLGKVIQDEIIQRMEHQLAG